MAARSSVHLRLLGLPALTLEGSLIKDEKVIHTGQVSLLSMAPLILAGVPLLFLFGIGLVLW